MCMTTVTEGPNKEASGVAWKVFDRHMHRTNSSVCFNGFRLPFHNYRLKKSPMLIGKTYKLDDTYAYTEKKEEKISASSGEEYLAGWHCFVNQEDAEKYAISLGPPAIVLKVNWKSQLAKGVQEIFLENGFVPQTPVVVVEEITILPGK